MQRVQAALKEQLNRQNEKLEIECREKVNQSATYYSIYVFYLE